MYSRPLTRHQGSFCSKVQVGKAHPGCEWINTITTCKNLTTANRIHRALSDPYTCLSLMSKRILFSIIPREQFPESHPLQRISLSPKILLVDTEQQEKKLLFQRAIQLPRQGSGFLPNLCADERFALGLGQE